MSTQSGQFCCHQKFAVYIWATNALDTHGRTKCSFRTDGLEISCYALHRDSLKKVFLSYIEDVSIMREQTETSNLEIANLFFTASSNQRYCQTSSKFTLNMDALVSSQTSSKVISNHFF